jgi:hypothetical protein
MHLSLPIRKKEYVEFSQFRVFLEDYRVESIDSAESRMIARVAVSLLAAEM